MIVDRIEYAAEYTGRFPHLADALALIRENPGSGKHTFPGGYLMRQEGQTKSLREGSYEAHRTYIDVQLLTEGQEIILWDRLENMTEITPYDPQTDRVMPSCRYPVAAFHNFNGFFRCAQFIFVFLINIHRCFAPI